MRQTKSHNMSKDAEAALLSELWRVDGRTEALHFAWECQGDLARIKARLHEVKESVYNPPAPLKDRMSAGASTREYQEGYLQGLTDAIGILERSARPTRLQPRNPIKLLRVRRKQEQT